MNGGNTNTDGGRKSVAEALEAAERAGASPVALAALRAELDAERSHAAPDSPAGAPGASPEPTRAPAPAAAPQRPLGTLDDLFRAGEAVEVDLAPHGFAVRFKVRPLSWSELAEVGVAFQSLAASVGAVIQPEPQPGALGPQPDQEPEPSAQDRLAQVAGMDPRAVRRGGDLQGRIVCQSVTAASRDGGASWEPIQVVPDQGAQNPARGRIWWGALPPGAVRAISDAATSKTRDGASSARPFRG